MRRAPVPTILRSAETLLVSHRIWAFSCHIPGNGKSEDGGSGGPE
jgi:hypothetical protein